MLRKQAPRAVFRTAPEEPISATSTEVRASADGAERLGHGPADAAPLAPAVRHRVPEVDAGVEARETILLCRCRESLEGADDARERQAVRVEPHLVAQDFDQR